MRIADSWTSARIRSRRDITPTIRLFEIVPDEPVLRDLPLGGHINVGVLIGGRADTRSYSLIGSAPSDAATDAYVIAVKRSPESRGGSAYMWSLPDGAALTVSNPRSHFHIDFGRRDYLLVAGGIGITPMVGAALALANHGANLRMMYCARTRDELAFADLLRDALGDRLTVHVSAEGTRLDLQTALASVAPGGLAAVFGPLPMIDEARRIWRALERPHPDLRFETFGSSCAHAPEPFRVRIANDGREIVVPETQSMLEALESAGIGVISDCQRGECGVCALNIIEIDGTVDHRDVFFSEHQKGENRKICACVSRAIGTITIDPLLRPDPARPGR